MRISVVKTIQAVDELPTAHLLASMGMYSLFWFKKNTHNFEKTGVKLMILIKISF